jgi:hypothetical protein
VVFRDIWAIGLQAAAIWADIVIDDIQCDRDLVTVPCVNQALS